MRQKGTADPTGPLALPGWFVKLFGSSMDFGKGRPKEAERFPLPCDGDGSGS